MSATHDFKVKNGLDVLNITQGYKLNGTTVLNYSGGNIELGDLGAGVNLHYSGSTKLATTSSGVTVTGSVTAPQLAITSASTADTVTLTRGTNGQNNMFKFVTGSTADWIVGERNDSTSDFRFYSYGTSSDVLSISRANGNVGIGLTSPASKLHIRTSTNNNYEFEEVSGELRFSALNDARSANVPLQFAASEFNFISL